ncbi:MAG: Asp-tRNA(Asn)/Glu-tRNA(Gln) amidotransferase subunit GatA [Chitinophagales bacterium]|nr:Asp-tRNA(Asn)/Glu-tRNA(Gln) amidotransferase subunit GatA [Chitinophagales bacterium]MDW8273268.1 Asp-tRNA(Asn)/Glu-tRNA(Gln) amidotransferase subunit GatA [Chitinophagales bacterium]
MQAGNHRTIRSIQKDCKEGTISVESVVQGYLENIRAHQHLNAFLEVFETEALERARALDEKNRSGSKTGKLFGAVVAIKDNICYKGHKVSAASKILEGYTSVYSATVVERLLAEDAIIIGRTNCDEFAMGSSNENSAYGKVFNAADSQRVPGGSSGGSAVAVQANMCTAALGSDTGGSIRQPAAFTGIVGLKPTYGRVSRYGLIAYASSFDQIGPMTRSVDDAALITEVIAGKDVLDSTTSSRPVPIFSASASKRKYRIAILENTFDNEALQHEIRYESQNLIDTLKSEGHVVETVAFQYVDYLIPAYYILTTAEASSNLARYDGVRYGYRSPAATDMDEVYKKSRTEGFGKEVKNRIMLGTFVLSAGYYDAYYSRAQKVRRILYQDIKNIFNQYDLILMPSTPTTAFKIGEKTDNPVEMYLADIFTVLANLTGNPAISFPIGKDKNQLPIGIQLIAPHFQEEWLFDFAGQYCREIN